MLPLEIALKEYGKEAWAGVETNPEVLKYFTETGYTFIHDDETPWCAAFLNWVLKQCNIQTKNKLNARSFLEIGTDISSPRLGDLVIFWRISPQSWQGHVGIFIRESSKLVFVLGGNQNSSVNIKAFPKTQVLGYRRVS